MMKWTMVIGIGLIVAGTVVPVYGEETVTVNIDVGMNVGTDNTNVGAHDPYANSSNDVNSATYLACREAVAILEGTANKGKCGKGTGFMCMMAGKKYLVTNAHVSDQTGALKVSFLKGTSYKIPQNTPVEVAENRDLVRFPLSDKVQGKFLEIATDDDVPQIGEAVEFYGNAKGGSVIVSTATKILAVGPEYIEIEAPIQGGNSGSPLVRVSDMKVIGVTTLSLFNKDNGDPSQKGTRFDPRVKKTRELAVRFADIKWRKMSYAQYLDMGNTRRDVDRFLLDVSSICGDLTLVRQFKLKDNQFKTRAFNDLMKMVAKADDALVKAIDRWNVMVSKNSETGGRGKNAIGGYKKADFDSARSTIKRRTVDCYKVRASLLERAQKLSHSIVGMSAEDKKYVVDLMDKCLREYNEKYRMQLKGMDLPTFR